MRRLARGQLTINATVHDITIATAEPPPPERVFQAIVAGLPFCWASSIVINIEDGIRHENSVATAHTGCSALTIRITTSVHEVFFIHFGLDCD